MPRGHEPHPAVVLITGKAVELPRLNHLFQTAGTGSPAEYGRIEETMSPEALKTIPDWILQNALPRRRG